MIFSRRALSLSGLGVVLAGAVLVACSDGGNLIGPPEPETPAARDTSLFAMQCEVNLQSRTLGCAAPSAAGGARRLIVGGQNVYVTLAASNFQTTVLGDPVTPDTLAMDVTVTNLIPQALGVNPDGTPDTVNGVRVFFNTGPTAVPSGTAEVANEDGEEVFLNSSQPYFRYPQVIAPQETSAPRRWKLAYSSGATSVRFTVYVDAEVEFPNGWVAITPGADTLQVGATTTLSGTALDVVGRPGTVSQTLSWSSSDAAVATVDPATGEVTAVARGSAVVTATNGQQSGTATIVVNNAPMAVADTIDALGNVTVPVDSAQGVLANDTDSNGDGLSVVTGTFPTARGGSVTFAADGSLQYLSPAGLEMAYDSVLYTVTDGVQSASAFLYINVGARVWYVQPGAAAPGNGTDALPFDALAGVDSIAGADETVYVLAGGSTPVVENGITLRTGQSLVGQALDAPVETTLNSRTVVLLATGDAPVARRTTAGATVRLGTNNAISGLRIGSTSGAALTGTDFGTLSTDSLSLDAVGGPALDLETGTLNVRLDSLLSTGSAGNGVRLAGVGGTLTANGGAVAGTFAVAGGTVSVTYPGSLSETDAALVAVSGTHTGTLTFSGTLSATGGTGLQFDDADGTYAFSGATTLGGGDAGIDVTGGSAGTFSFGTSTTITNPTGDALAVAASAPTLTYAGSITTNTGRPVSVGGLTGGSVEVSGAIAATGLGILVADNTAGGVRFTGSSKNLNTGSNPAVVLSNNGSGGVLFSGGGLQIATASGAGFSAVGTGSVEVTGAGNTVATGTGVPVRIEGTTITGSGVTFAQLSANGAASGIVLSNTGTTNGLQVTGDGSNAAGSGGTIQNTTGAAVRLTNTLQTSLAYLTITGAAGGIVADTFGTLAVNNVSIASTGAPALDLTAGDVTGTFSSVSASGATNGVDLTAVTGLFAANGGTVAGGAGAAFNLAGGDVGVVWNGSISQGNDAPLVSIGGGHNTGTVTFQTGTLSAANGSGLRFDNADGTYVFSGTTTLNGGRAGIDIVGGSAGSFTFGSTTTIGSTVAGDTAFFVGGSNPGVVFNGGIAKNSAGPLVQLTDVSGGSLTFGTGTLSATAGTGLQFSNADATVAFNGTVTLNGGDAGVDILAGSDGNFTFGSGVAITSPTGTAFNVSGSSPTVAMRGPITKASAGFAVDIANMAAGNVTFGNGLADGSATPVLSATAGDGIRLSNVDGTVNFTGTTTMNGGAARVQVIGGSDGVVYFAPTTSITNPTGIALEVNGGTPALVYRGTITHNTGRAVAVQNVSGDSVVVSGSVASGTSGSPVGQGILVQGNTGGVIAFDGSSKSLFTGGNPAVSLVNNTGATMRFGGGGLAITTTTGNGFSATGGGTVQVTGAGNTLAATGGVPLNVQNTTIGASGLSFQSISATGGANGIVLVNTGAVNGLQVTGTGVVGSGGTIVNTSGADGAVAGNGVYLDNAVNVNLSWMNLSGHANHAVRGNNASNVSLTRLRITGTNGSNAGANEGSVSFDNLTGTASITSSYIEGGFEDNVRVVNTAGTLNRLTMTGDTIGHNGTTGNDGLLLDASGTAVLNVTVQNSRFTGARSNNVHYVLNGNAAGDFVFTGNVLTNNHPNKLGSDFGINVGSTSNGAMTYTISGNSVNDAGGSGIEVSHLAGGSGAMTGSITNNTVGTSGVSNSGSNAGSTIVAALVGAGTTATHTTTITGNTLRQYTNYGIRLINRGTGNGYLNASVTNNNIAEPSPNAAAFSAYSAIRAELGASSTGPDNGRSCLDISGNTLNQNAGSSQATLRIFGRFGTRTALPGLTGAGANAFLQSQNTITGTNPTPVNATSTNAFQSSCPPV